MPIAAVGLHIAAGNGNKHPKVEWFNPYARELRRQEAREAVSVRAAHTFLQLYEAQRIPGWVLSVIDLDLIKLAAD